MTAFRIGCCGSASAEGWTGRLLVADVCARCSFQPDNLILSLLQKLVVLLKKVLGDRRNFEKRAVLKVSDNHGLICHTDFSLSDTPTRRLERYFEPRHSLLPCFPLVVYDGNM
ncbi:hypothetical protein BKE38_11135 [Pseudoroseomonas deserti]|uniref:Uncharacterized protein n=1 Tax=Teichococcus deserti TaxID=1817963 RepID=A0A1V2H2Q3_9PROT|nr:hypothetical protein BKE38_11135 [Pseudoroseomonas deserti]